MKTSQLERLMRELHLPGMRSGYKDMCSSARKEGFSYETFLEQLLELEQLNRRNNKIERLLRASRIGKEKCRTNFEMKRVPKQVLSRINQLWDGQFLNNKENILCFGNPGSGKTHLLSAVGLELIRQGKRIEMYSCSLLIQKLLAEKENLNLERYINKLCRNDAILIDDIGYVQQTREEMEVFFTFLAQCYETISLMVTSNLPFSQWDKIFKDPMTTAAAIDRLVHHSIILELNIPSYRMEKAKKKP